jgi:hypothetical protein
MGTEHGFLTLAAEIRQELSNLERLTREIPATWRRREDLSQEDRLPYVESTALKLHNLYSGCERIFEMETFLVSLEELGRGLQG